MNNQKQTNDKKITTKFIIISICSLFGGAVLGLVLAILCSILNSKGLLPIDINNIINTISSVSIYVIVILAIFTIIWSIISISRSKKLLQSFLETEDDDVYRRIDIALDSVLTVTNISYVLSIGLFGLFCYDMINQVTSIWMLAGVVLYMLTLAIGPFFQGKAVSIIKQLNPEKEGNILDNKFRKIWLSTCDEAELHIIHEAGYNSYIFMSSLYMVIMVILVIAGMFFTIGILPIILVTLLYTVHLLSYIISAKKLEHPKK